MKLTTKLLKSLIREAKAEQKRKKGIFKSDLSAYELEDIDTDQQMINMLGEILNQLKTLVYYSTPARSTIAAAGEKQWAGSIQEGVVDEIVKGLESLNVDEILPPDKQEDAATAAITAVAAMVAAEQSEKQEIPGAMEESLYLIRKIIEEEMVSVLNENQIITEVQINTLDELFGTLQAIIAIKKGEKIGKIGLKI